MGMKIVMPTEGTRQPRLLKTLACAALFTAQLADAAQELPDIFAYRAQDLAALRKGFAQSPPEAQPWVFWFWWNSVVSREEIARELEELAAAGFGGAEIRVVTFHGWGGKPLPGMDAANLERLGHRQLAYLSDEWVDAMEFTCAKAQKLGLRLALNLGQGWPPGGPWITDAHRTKHLTWKSHAVEGSTRFTQADLPTTCLAFAWQLVGPAKTVATNSFQDLTRFIQREGSRRSLSWEVPVGRWLVGIFSVTPGGICDKGEGPEVDPASREAVLFHLNYMFSRLDPKLRRFYGTTLVDMASDSWEYETPRGGGRYWSPALLGAFPTQAGYDLRERMHALLGYGPDAEQVRRDLEAVERRLVHENYFATVQRFLHERGLRHRPQVYGRGLARDLLEAYTLVDTPEVEQGDYCLPEAAWVGRTTGKPIISCEAFTHLHLKMGTVRRPHGEWESSPSHLRGAANAIFGEGINRIQMHSFGYSPPSLPLPGWRMYAEIHLNRNVPWWPFMKPLNTWLARQQWLLQAGWPVADALVYPVKSNPDDGPFRQMGDRQPISSANAVDCANEQTLSLIPAACAAGDYQVNHVVLLDELKTLADAAHILALLDTGARVVCAHSLPEQWPALRALAEQPMRVRFAAAQAEGRVLDARTNGWSAALTKAQSVRWSPATTNLVFQHRRVSGADVYVLFNCGDDFQGEVSFPHWGARAEHWDADTGRIAPVARMSDRDDRVYVPLSLGHSESRAFVFSPTNRPVHVTQAPEGEFDYAPDGGLRGRFGDTGEYLDIRLSDGTGRKQVVAVPAPVVVSGPWQLSVSATQAVSPQPPQTLRLERLVSWRELPELKHYAGAATYTTAFDLKPELIGDDRGLVLHLGAVFELARVSVNGREAGTAYAPPFRVDVTALVKAGRNTLAIEVPNQLKNHLERGDNYRRPSGLLGPVLLVPDRRITLADGRKTSPPPVKAPAAGCAADPSKPKPRRFSPPSVSTADVRQTDIFRSGEDGYHTYRIPALIESRQGRLLAFCEGRKNSDNDRGDIDLLLKRSTDGGKTWLPAQIVWDDGMNTCGNPCPVVDRDTGVIWLLMSWNFGQLLREADVQVGFGEDSRRVFVTRSADEGATWSAPVEITAAVKRPEWTWYATGPGNGIQLRNGRLVIPCDHKVKGTLTYHSHTIHSDDHGRTWQLGGIADDTTNESTVVELEDGALLLNMRNRSGWNRRAIARSRDGGSTWSPVEYDDALVESMCQGSLVTVRRWNEASDRLLFSNPADTWRARMTVRLSRDGGGTWPAARLIHEGPSAYSSLCVLPEGEVGLLYESGEKRPYERITYARFSLRWLAAGDERMETRQESAP
jgi:sialidase-1